MWTYTQRKNKMSAMEDKWWEVPTSGQRKELLKHFREIKKKIRGRAKGGE